MKSLVLASILCISCIGASGCSTTGGDSPQEQAWTQRWENSSDPFRTTQCDQWNADPETYLQNGPAALGQPMDLVRRMMDQYC